MKSKRYAPTQAINTGAHQKQAYQQREITMKPIIKNLNNTLQAQTAVLDTQIKSICPETGLFLLALFALNCHLLLPADPLYFQADKVAGGEWWRIFTFPFVHISLFHLALDAGAFLLLYNSLEEKRWSRRIFYVGVCGAASLLLTLVTTTQIHTLGLCGLSGIAHGLMAVSALEMIRSKSLDRSRIVAGWAMLVVVIGKSIFEAVTGHVMFEWLYFGLIGTPLVYTHLGGVLGGILGFFGMKVIEKK